MTKQTGSVKPEMSDEDNDVTILFGDRQEGLAIEDLDPEILKLIFGLDFVPLLLKLEGSNKNVLLRNRDQFVAGKTFYSKEPFTNRQSPIFFIFYKNPFWS